MNFLHRLSSQTWIIALICVSGFLLWMDTARVRRVDYVSGLGEPPVTSEAASPTGYKAGLRRLIVPEHNNESYQWIAQTQQMLAGHDWRVRHVGYDNAPFGREVRTPSPYRWWLGLVAWAHQVVAGQPTGQAVERAAIWADPILHLLLVIGAVIFTARQCGNLPATLLAFGLAIAFPFIGAFLPGQPGDSGLVLVCGFWSVLLLLAGISPIRRPGEEQNGQLPAKRTRQWFFIAGIVGAMGLWVSVPRELLILAGISIGGFFVGWVRRQDPAAQVAPWRVWALGGATAILAAYLIEYFPAHMEALRLDTIHPLFGVAWLGVGELLEQASAWRQGKPSSSRLWRIISIGLAILAVASVPVALRFDGSVGFATADAFASRLSNLPNSAVAPNLWTWLVRDGITATAVATFLPVLVLGPAIWLLSRKATAAGQREKIALALGPALLALGLACFQIGGWSVADGMLLALLVVTVPVIGSAAKSSRWSWMVGLAVILIPGAVLVLNQTRAETQETVAESDVVALIERDLAYWLTKQAGSGGSVVLAPPNTTTSFYFHGGLSGLGTPYRENKDGFAAAIRIAGSTSPEEAQTLAQNRNLSYIVVPSWDGFLDEYARLGSRQPDHSVVALLHQWLPPRWLRPVPYHVPKISGFEGLSVAVFQVTDVQDNPTALGRLAEYFIEMDQIDQAVSVSQALERLFPDELGALVSRSLVEQAAGNTSAATKIMNELPAYVTRGDDSSLPWDRRVSLAIALTEGKRFEAAKEETKRCLAELDEANIRLLTPVSLYRLQVLTKSFGLEIADARLRVLARELLPTELSEKL